MKKEFPYIADLQTPMLYSNGFCVVWMNLFCSSFFRISLIKLLKVKCLNTVKIWG